jgi:hypothetical protein
MVCKVDFVQNPRGIWGWKTEQHVGTVSADVRRAASHEAVVEFGPPGPF